MPGKRQRIVPNFWLDKEAEEAAAFYVDAFDSGTVVSTSRYTEIGKEFHGMEPGTAMTVEFEIEGFRFTALNAGPIFKPNPSISFFVNRRTAAEVDKIYGRLAEGGTELMPLDSYPFSKRYGWVQDRFGISWQVILSEGEPAQPIFPSLMFVGDVCEKAREAIEFYTSLFPNSELLSTFPYGPNQAPDKEGTLAYADFRLDGELFAAMDSAQAHDFAFSEGISLLVNCSDQAEIDHYWSRLSADPDAEQCGWLKDKYGVSWQIVPTALAELVGDQSTEASRRAFQAMFQMKKLDIAELQRAYDGA